MSTSLHLAGPADAEKLLPLIAAFHEEEQLDLSDAHRRRAVVPLLEGSPHGAVYVAGPRSAPVGYLIVCFGWSVELGGLDGFLDELYVRPKVRGRGIASEMLSRAARSLAEAGVMSLTLEVDHDNTSAQSLYSRLGFKDRGRYGLMALPLRSAPLGAPGARD